MSLAEAAGPLTDQKLKAIRLSLSTAVALAILKLAVGFLTNSLAVLSSAADSIGDVLSSLFNLFFLEKAEKPADEDHHFGHGKFENFASLMQGFILLGSAGFLVYRSVVKLLHPETMHRIDLGVGTIVVCFLISFVVGKKVHRVGHESHSDLLKAEAAHLLVDSYLYLIVILALILSRFGFLFFDPIACFIVAGYIIWIAAKIVKSSFDVLTDKALKNEENEAIVKIIKEHYPTILGFDRFKSRKGGSKKFINFRLFLCKKITLDQAHDVIDHIEKEIESQIPDSEIMIHGEPTKEDCLKHEHALHPHHYRKRN